MALGPRGAHGLCCTSRPKHHAGSGPLSSNVRQHDAAMKVLATVAGAAVASKAQMHSRPASLQARHSKSGSAQVPRSALLPSQLSLQRFAATNLCLSMRWFQSVRGAAATRKSEPVFIAGIGGGLSNVGSNSPRWRICAHLGNSMPLYFVPSRRSGSPQAVLPNPSLERTRTGMALGPRGSQA